MDKNDGLEVPQQQTNLLCGWALKASTKMDRNSTFKRYFPELEPRCQGWVQIKIRNFLLAKVRYKIPLNVQGDKYEDGKGIYVELHVNLFEYAYELGSKHSPYGVHMSVRMPPGSNPLVMVGHNEVIFMIFPFGDEAVSLQLGLTGPYDKDRWSLSNDIILSIQIIWLWLWDDWGRPQ